LEKWHSFSDNLWNTVDWDGLECELSKSPVSQGCLGGKVQIKVLWTQEEYGLLAFPVILFMSPMSSTIGRQVPYYPMCKQVGSGNRARSSPQLEMMLLG